MKELLSSPQGVTWREPLINSMTMILMGEKLELWRKGRENRHVLAPDPALDLVQGPVLGPSLEGPVLAPGLSQRGMVTLSQGPDLNLDLAPKILKRKRKRASPSLDLDQSLREILSQNRDPSLRGIPSRNHDLSPSEIQSRNQDPSPMGRRDPHQDQKVMIEKKPRSLELTQNLGLVHLLIMATVSQALNLLLRTWSLKRMETYLLNLRRMEEMSKHWK